MFNKVWLLAGWEAGDLFLALLKRFNVEVVGEEGPIDFLVIDPYAHPVQGLLRFGWPVGESTGIGV